MSTFLGSAPWMMKPAIITLSPVCTLPRVEMLPSRAFATGVGDGLGDGGGVGVATGVGVGVAGGVGVGDGVGDGVGAGPEPAGTDAVLLHCELVTPLSAFSRN